MSILHKPVVASGQQIGPLHRFSRRVLARWALRSIDVLGVRDPLSLAVASAVGVPRERIVLTGDDAWALAPALSAAARATLKRHGIREPFIAVQMRFGGSVGWSEVDSQSFAIALSGLSSALGLPVAFFPCMLSLGKDDRYAAACVRQHLDVESWSLTEELDAPTTKAILGRAALAVGTANHFCVFAASMGSPVIGIYATPYMEQKLNGLAKLWPHRVKALSKETGVNSGVLIDTARQLLVKQAETSGVTGEPSTVARGATGGADISLARLVGRSSSPTA